MGGQRFLSEHRIRRGADFERVYRQRCSVSDKWLVIYGRENGLRHPRLGLSVSRRLGGAVVRNRWKRLIREAFRLSRPELPQGLDLVVIPRPTTAEPELDRLIGSLRALAGRLALKLGRQGR